jgi:eukaryotic-like serine/threonine-protein kinase
MKTVALAEILHAIGAGGMGEVYRARDTRLGRVVALKVLAPSLVDDVAWRAQFESEARAVSAINHAHICTLFRSPSEAAAQKD